MPKDKTWDSSQDDPLAFKKRKLQISKDKNDDKNSATENETTDNDKKVVQGEAQRDLSLGGIFHHEVGANFSADQPNPTKNAAG